MSYRYRPERVVREQRIHHLVAVRKRSVLSALFVVCGILVLLVIGTTITGFVTHTGSLEKGLAQAQSDIAALTFDRERCLSQVESAEKTSQQATAQLQGCSGKLEINTKELTSCVQDRTSLTEKSNRLDTVFNTCDQERTSLHQQLADQQQTGKEILTYAVRALCCSLNDVQQGVVRTWSITANTLSCTGNATMNCTSGVGDF